MKNLLLLCPVEGLEYRVQERNKIDYCNRHKKILIDNYFSVIHNLKSVKKNL